jgi:tetratricopeptide (TPR) repeat protein
MRIAAVASLLCLLAAPALADTLLLRDGRIVDGRKMVRAADGVKIEFENGEVLVPNALVEDALIEGAESSFTPVTDEERAKVGAGLLPWEGRWIPAKRRADLVAKKIAEKKAELEEIRKHAAWKDKWEESTAHFNFQYTVPPHVFAYYRDMMEAYFSEFAKVWKVSQPKEFGKLTVCFYTNLTEFHRTGGVGGGVRGYFKFVPPLELNFYYDRIDGRYTEQVMFHEANHYLQLLLDPKFSMPHFPGEAIAEYYGASVYDPLKKELVVGLIQDGRLTDIKNQADTGEMHDLKKLLETDELYEHYSWGWSFVHFLMNRPDYRKKFEKWVIALVKAKDIDRESMGDMKTVRGPEVLRSFMKYMGIKTEDDLKKLEKEWHAYVKDELTASSARGIAMAAMGAVNTGRTIRAKRLFKEAIEAGDRTPSTYHEYGRLLMMDDAAALDEAISIFRKAIEMDPLVGQFYTSLAGALIKKEQKPEALKLAKLAMELDPDDMWLQYRAKELVEDASK